MESTLHKSAQGPLPPGCRLAPLHRVDASTSLLICLLINEKGPAGQPWVLLRSEADADVYAGVVCDCAGEIHELVEIAVQNLHLEEFEHSPQKYQVANFCLDERWAHQLAYLQKQTGRPLLHTPFEKFPPRPLLIKLPPAHASSPFCETEAVAWELCRDDHLLEQHGLPPYSTSRYRYLFNPEEPGQSALVSTDPRQPSGVQVLGLDKVQPPEPGTLLFNPKAGLLRVSRQVPLDLESLSQIIEGKRWEPALGQEKVWELDETLRALRNWSHDPKGPPFRLFQTSQTQQHGLESLYLKLTLLLGAFQTVREYVRAHQLPLLNLKPENLGVCLPAGTGGFPGLWQAQCRLIEAGQAYPLEIKNTEQKYFVRLGTIRPSPFTPEGVGAHSFGIGRIQIRSVTEVLDGSVLDGTLVAEDYLGLDPHDLLWFKLPLGDTTLEFHATVQKTDARAQKEARFRTVPAKFPAALIQRLNQSAGVYFPKSPYEIWPLLSSPSDLFSLGVIAVRLLFCDSESNLPAVLDEVLSLARRQNDATDQKTLAESLLTLLDTDARVRELLIPPHLGAPDIASQSALTRPVLELWSRVAANVLSLFPGTGKFACCKSFGDVSPLALEAVFDSPIRELKLELALLRSLLITNPFDAEEIAALVLEESRR